VAVTVTNTCEGTNGAAVTTANTGPNGWDLVTLSNSGTATFDTTVAHGGASSLKLATTATAGTAFVTWSSSFTGTTVATAYSRVYLYLTAIPAATVALMRYLSTASTNAAILQLTTTGKIRTYNAAGSVLTTGTTTIPLNQWVRVEFDVTGDAVNGSISARLYTSPESTTAAETITNTTVNTSNPLDRIRIGMSATIANQTMWLDDIALSDVGPIGPVASGAAFTGAVTLGGGGTLTAAGTPTAADTVTLGGGGTLAVTGTPTAAGTVTVGGTGTLTVTGAPSFTGTVALGGTGTLTVAAVPPVTGTVTLGGTGTLTVTGAPSFTGTVALGGTGTVTGTGAPSLTGYVTNRAIDPSLEIGTTGGGSNNSSLYPATFDTAVFYSGGRSLRTDRTATTPSTQLSSVFLGAASLANTTKIMAQPGEVLSLSVRVLAPASNANARGTLNVSFRDSAGATIGSSFPGTSVSLTPGQWTEVKRENVTAPATSFYVLASCSVVTRDGTNAPTGSQVWFDAFMVNTGPTVLPYFDGTYAGSTWTGAANASASQQTALPLAGTGTLGATGQPAFTGTATLGGTGTLTVTGAPSFTAGVTLGGTGTLTVPGRPTVSGTVTVGGTGTLTGTGTPTIADTATLGGGGTLTVTGMKVVPARDVTATATLTHDRAAVILENGRGASLPANRRAVLMASDKGSTVNHTKESLVQP
jgi:fibronectin-binding autotransporter adhesin